MKVDIGAIREERGGAISFKGTEELELPKPEIPYELTGPVSIAGVVTNTGSAFLVQAEVGIKYRAACGRCLEDFTTEKTFRFDEQFLPGIPRPEDDDTVYRFTGDTIDLRNCIDEQILLNLPMSVICRPDCQGLCPSCGTNRNQQQCDCTTETINPQFAKLKDLLLPKGGGTNGQS